MSTAYYALFHLLVSEATSAILPSRPAALPDVVRRGFQHTAMKELCAHLAKGDLRKCPPVLRQVFTDPMEPELADIAQAFVDLQISRHQADYAPHLAWSAARARTLIRQVKNAFSAWQQVRGTDNANAFCAALLLHKTWRIE